MCKTRNPYSVSIVDFEQIMLGGNGHKVHCPKDEVFH